MGKSASDTQLPGPEGHVFGESASAISLASPVSELPTTRYFDDDPAELNDNDLPPLYSDQDNVTRPFHGSASAPSLSSTPGGPVDPLLPAAARGFGIRPFKRDPKTETTYYIDRRLSTDPTFLQDQITKLSHVPPRPRLQIRGTHKQAVKKGDRTETRTIVDFDVQLELTYLLYTDIHAPRAWRQLKTVTNFEKVRRGTVFTTRAPGFGGSGVAEEGQPGLDAWCHRFCASHYGLRSFVFERRISGWDVDYLQEKLEAMVRATNYHGKLQVTFPVHNSRVEIYNDCRTNRWRLTKWVEMLFVFTLLFLFAWPWVFFRTRRWETVYAEWPMSRTETQEDGTARKRYAHMSEERWYNMWARAISKAVIERRQGVLDQSDLQRAEGAPAREEGFGGAVQAGVEAMGVVNRSFGWGADSY